MNSWTHWLLWADRERIRAMSENFRGEGARLDTDDVLIGLACLTGLALAGWALARYVAFRERARRVYSPRGLFDQLCQAHGLDRASCKALLRLAQQEQLEHPARLFLEPDRFDRPSAAIAESRDSYKQLQRRIFGEPGA